MRQSDFVSDLSANIDASRVRSAGPDDTIGSVTPRVCVRVVSTEEICALWRSRSFSDHPKPAVMVRGGATMLGVGNPPQKLDLVLETASMAKISEYRPEDMTVTVQAGVLLADLNRTLADNHQRLVLDADEPSRATIGGLLACDRPGAFGYGFGGARDCVLGIEVVDGRGRKLRFGGRVVKNVAGYDVTKLFLGSYGTLGIITEATLRIHPLPETSETIEFHFHSLECAKRFRSSVFACPMQPVTCDVAVTLSSRDSDELQWNFRIVLEGTYEEVDAQRERYLALAREAATVETPDAEILTAKSSTGNSSAATATEYVLRMGCGRADPLDSCRQMALDLRGSTTGSHETTQSINAHLGSGTMIVRFSSDDDDKLSEWLLRLRRRAESAGGYLVLESAPVAVARKVECWGSPPGGFALMRKIKRTYDPDNILAPGRFVGGI